MKKLLTTLFVALSTSVFACWFTESNFNATYIASVNGSAVHYSPANSIGSATYSNGQLVSLPLTVQIKVSPRFSDQAGETLGEKPIVEAILQYKIVRQNGTSTDFITVKKLENPTWKMNFANPVNLFGTQGIIDISKSNISSGDSIIIRVYFSDGTYHTGDLDEQNIGISDTPATQSNSRGNISVGNTWVAPHVFRVVFNGKRRLMI